MDKVRICKAPIHGTRYAYSRKKCRCPDAVAAKAAEFKQWKDRKRANLGPVLIENIEVRRMIYALRAAGWTDKMLSDKLGYKHTSGLTNALRPQRVHPTTHARISALYDALHHVPGPSWRNRARAVRDGWAPPLAWDDITDPEATPQGVREHDAGRAWRYQKETWYEYQCIRESGMGHEFALRELGITHDAWQKLQKAMEQRRTA